MIWGLREFLRRVSLLSSRDTMQIINITKECDDGKRTPGKTWAWKHVAVHRIWFDDWDLGVSRTAVEIARRFIDDMLIRKYTGGEQPYHFLVDDVGRWWQVLPLEDVGKHARRWNHEALGVGVIGDFRKQAPTAMQRAALVENLAALCLACGINPNQSHSVATTLDSGTLGRVMVPALCGHDEMPGGSADPNKKCPGRFLSMDDLRRDVAWEMQRPSQIALEKSGAVVRW